MSRRNGSNVRIGPLARLWLHVADLNGRLRVGVVGNVGEDLLRVRTERGRKGVSRIKIEMPHGDIGRRRAGRAARNALLDRDALAGNAELLLDHGHVLGEVVVHVELAACTVGIEHAHLDHGHLPESMFRSGTLSALRYLAYLTRARTISDPQQSGRCCSLARLSVPLL